MKQHMVVTNLRMPADDWMRVKAAAANAGMSANKYIQYMFDEATKRDFFGITDLPTLPRKKQDFTNLYGKLLKNLRSENRWMHPKRIKLSTIYDPTNNYFCRYKLFQSAY